LVASISPVVLLTKKEEEEEEMPQRRKVKGKGGRTSIGESGSGRGENGQRR
jgi:hypothetical protein